MGDLVLGPTEGSFRAQLFTSSPGVSKPRRSTGRGRAEDRDFSLTSSPSSGLGLRRVGEGALKVVRGEGQPRARLQLGPPRWDLPAPTSRADAHLRRNLWPQCRGSSGHFQSTPPCHPFPASAAAASRGTAKNQPHPPAKARHHLGLRTCGLHGTAGPKPLTPGCSCLGHLLMASGLA